MSARKAEQRAIREANATNESLIAAMPDMLFQLDGDLRIVRHHAASESDLAMPPSSFLGRRLDEVLPTETARRFGSAALARSGRVQRVEYSSARHGSRRHFEARLGAIPTGGTLLVLRDMTELKDAELALPRERGPAVCPGRCRRRGVGLEHLHGAGVPLEALADDAGL